LNTCVCDVFYSKDLNVKPFVTNKNIICFVGDYFTVSLRDEANMLNVSKK